MVAGAAHVNAFGKSDYAGNVSGSEIELRTIVGEEGLMSAAFFFGKNVNLTLELGVRMDRAGLCENLTTLDF